MVKNESYLYSVISMICYKDVTTFIQAYSRWIPDLPICFTPCAELVQ